MKQDNTTYSVWIGGSCDYGHKERAGAAAIIVEQGGEVIKRDVIADLYTTEFRMMLRLMAKQMEELQEGSDILFLTNAAYIQNFDKTPTTKSANPDLIQLCLEKKGRHNSVCVKIVPYHKSPLLIETHDMSTDAMKKLREEYHRQKKQQSFSLSLERVIHMEQWHDLIRDAVDCDDTARLRRLKNEIQALQSYYYNGEWLADFDADNEGLFPKDLKRGVLTEDALYDLFIDVDAVIKNRI